MSDMIDRDAVAKAVATLSQEFLDGGSPTAVKVLNLAMDRIRATPAADARAEALDGEQISRAAKFMAMALWSELHEKAGPGVLPEKLPKAAADVLRALMQEKLKTALIGGAE